MKPVIIDETKILKRIEELEKGNESMWWKERDSLKQILSQSTPLPEDDIKPLQDLVDEGYDPYDEAHHLQVQRMLEVIEKYIKSKV